jgi:hypothetical protein
MPEFKRLALWLAGPGSEFGMTLHDLMERNKEVFMTKKNQIGNWTVWLSIFRNNLAEEYSRNPPCGYRCWLCLTGVFVRPHMEGWQRIGLLLKRLICIPHRSRSSWNKASGGVCSSLKTAAATVILCGHHRWLGVGCRP